MPRSTVILGPAPLDGDTVAAAAATVWREHGGPDADPFELRVLDGGAVLQVVAGGVALVSVLRPRMLPTLDEVARLLPYAEPPERTSWWTEAYTPWHAEGAIGVAILDAAAAASGSIAWHQGGVALWKHDGGGLTAG